MKMSQVETASWIVLKFVEAFNRHNVVEMMEWISDFCLFKSFTTDRVKYHEKTKIRQYWEDFFRQYLEANLDVEEIIGFGVRCVARWELT
ncbi:MAG: nuclear transport factor 2 family protein [Candidatus Oleimicrobiaceae bacterium]